MGFDSILPLSQCKNLNSDLLSAFSLSDFEEKALRFKNTISFEQYCKGDFLDPKAFEVLNQQDYLIESFFLGLRTDRGVRNLEHFAPILVPNYLEKSPLMQSKVLSLMMMKLSISSLLMQAWMSLMLL